MRFTREDLASLPFHVRQLVRVVENRLGRHVSADDQRKLAIWRRQPVGARVFIGRLLVRHVDRQRAVRAELQLAGVERRSSLPQTLRFSFSLPHPSRAPRIVVLPWIADDMDRVYHLSGTPPGSMSTATKIKADQPLALVVGFQHAPGW